MRIRFLRLLPFLILSLITCRMVEGKMIVGLKPEVSLPASLSLSQGNPGWKYLPGVDLYRVEEEEIADLKGLRESGLIERIEPEAQVQLEALPDDPLIEGQGWIGQGFDIGIEEAWVLTTGDPRVTVAIIDTGIDPTHPDLQENLWTNEGEIPGNGIDDDRNGFIDDRHGFNFRDENSDVGDENSHGSHLAGVIGAVGDNGSGIAGVNWKVRLMPLKFTDAKGSGTTTAAIEAIDYAIRNGADIINASWTLKLDNPADRGNLLERAIQKAGEAGILFVTASGNQFATGQGLDIDKSPVYPAAFKTENLITVAAIDEEGSLASYSNYGKESVGLAAPGSGILSTVAGGEYGIMSGTSVAAAFVSGAAGLLLSRDPGLTPAEIKNLLEETVSEKDSLRELGASGGILNIGNSLAALTGLPLPQATRGERPPPAEAPVLSEPAPAGGGCSLIP